MFRIIISLRMFGIPKVWGVWLICWGLVISVGNTYAQNRPVQATVVFVPPYTLSLADYAAPTSNKLQLSLLLRDAASPLRRVKLRFVIEGAGITIRTSQAYLNSSRPIGINLVPNVPTTLSGVNAAFREYFNPTNLEVLGLDRNQFVRSKSLPSGIYRWRIEILDYNLLVPLNNAQLSQQTLWMIRAQAPIVNLPTQSQKLRATNYGLQNVIFQWFNRSGSSPNSAFTTEYYVSLYEVYEPNNARVADARTAPRTLVYRNTLPLTNTTLIYNNTFPMLTPGKRYIFQVQARDREGRDLFENQGFSEAVVFQYGEECVPPTGIKAESTNTESIKLSWNGIPGTQTGYKVRYRPLGSSDDDWQELTSQFNDLTISRLQADREYEYEVSSICGQLDGTSWTRGTVKTRAPNPANFVCGTPQSTYDMSNQEPLGILNKNDVVLAGGYRVKIRRATGGNGQFSGVGVAEVPLGNTKVKLKVGFKNIFINSGYRMLRGQIYAARNKWQAMAMATPMTVNGWRLTQDGKVEIKTNGTWKRMPLDGGQDYMLVDAQTGKKRFVDRNGRMYIPLDERDYSKLSPQEIVIEAKKLLQEADEAIEDGRYGDAIELAAKAEELLDSIGKKVGKIVGFGKLVVEIANDMIKEKQQKEKEIIEEYEEKSKTLLAVAAKINGDTIQSGDTTNIQLVILEDDIVIEDGGEEVNKLFDNNPDFKRFKDAYQKQDTAMKKVADWLMPILILRNYTSEASIKGLVDTIKTTAEAIYQTYNQLKNDGKDEQTIKNRLDKDIRKFLKEFVDKELKTLEQNLNKK